MVLKKDSISLTKASSIRDFLAKSSRKSASGPEEKNEVILSI